MKLVAFFAHWLGRQFLGLMVISLILIIGGYLYSGIQSYIDGQRQKSNLKAGQSQLQSIHGDLEAEAKQRVQGVRKDSQAELDRRISELVREIANLELQRRSEIERKLALINGDFTQDIKLDLHIDLLKQEHRYLDHAKAALNAAVAIAKGSGELERRRNAIVGINANWHNVDTQINVLETNSPVTTKIPLTSDYHQLKSLEAQRDALFQQSQNANEAYWSQKKYLDALQKPRTLLPFEPIRGAYENASSAIQERILQEEVDLANNWITRYVDPALKVMPTAFLILLAAILSPIAIKGLFFYIVAPIASRRPAICLAPESGGDLDDGRRDAMVCSNASHVSLATTLTCDEELLIHPEYLRGPSSNSIASTKWLLNNRYPFTSIAAGLYVLTRLQADTDHTHIISAIEDPLAEVALIEISAGSTLVLQPRHIIGVIQSRSQPLHLESKWRLLSVTAWLTLQLRYMIFSGPAKILVKGCRGVRVDPVGAGHRINQAATIGFSGNLSYSVSRCDPFVAYVRGKHELFDDKFSGESGYYISEEMPNLGKSGGITGKGLEGLADSVLKVFGI